MADKPDRNARCHCGSGKKYKNCCKDKDGSQITSKMGMIAIGLAIVLGLVFLSMTLSSGGGAQDCPAGTVWSSVHQHCH